MEHINICQALSVNIHAAPCLNRCRHCWTEGHPHHKEVPPGQVMLVIEKLGEMRSRLPYVNFFLLDEPAMHRGFVTIMERASELGLISTEFFLATNGCVLAKAPDSTWSRLKKTGCNCLQFTFYGMEDIHDRFAGRPGAFKDLLTAVRRAGEFGMEWFAQIPLHPENVAELETLMDFLNGMDRGGQARIGWFPFLWQGRGRSAMRVRGELYRSLPDNLTGNRLQVVEEKQAIERILSDSSLSDRKGGDSMCPVLTLQIERNLQVFCGGACDSGGIAAAVPELKKYFFLGELNEEGFEPLLENYRLHRPQILGTLDRITWGELAERYGDRSNDEIFYLNDLPEHKWSAAFLVQEYGVRQSV